MTITTSLENDVATAAQAAAALIPSSSPLTAQAPVDLRHVIGTVPQDAVAVRADVVGARSGVVVVIAESALTAVMAQAPMGPLPLGEALRPALESLQSALGVGAIGPVTSLSAGEALASLAELDAVVVPLDGPGGARAWLAVASGTTGSAARTGGSEPFTGAGLELLQDVVMELSAELGRTTMTVRDLLSLQPGAVVELDRLAGSPADLLVNGRLIARGEVVVVDEDYALKITELVYGSMQEHG